MIKANELRIGNLVVKSDQIHSDSPQYGQITTVYVDKANVDYHYPLTWYKPIPLTEEWLLKFGFEKYDEIYWFLPNYPSYEICPNEPLQLFLPCETTDESEYYVVKDSNCKIQYVHQLQNLYFALTGEELTIKE